MRSPSNADADRSVANRAIPCLALAIALAAATLVSVWQTPQRINHDCAAYLQQAEILLDGGVPYCDFVDVNPPLNSYLNVLPAWLARGLHLSPIVVFQVLVIALLFVSALEISVLLRKRRSGLRPAEQGLVLLTWLGLYFLVDWRGDVGQREHLFVLLYVPCLFLRILRHRGGSVPIPFALLLGIQAGLGTSLKPHFLLAAIGVEIVLLLASRRWRTLLQPECMALVGVVAVYAAHWLFVPAAMREAYFGRWVPWLCRTYRAFDVSYRDIAEGILTSPFSAAGLVGVLAAVLVLSMQRRPMRRRPHLLALASLGVMGLALVLLQQKGWSYHRIPLDAAGLLCLAMIGVTTAESVLLTLRVRLRRLGLTRSVMSTWRTAAGRGLICGVFGVLLAAWFVGRPGSGRPEAPEYLALRRIIEQRSQPGDRVLVVATSVRPAYPMLLQTGRRPGSRYLCALPIALLYAGVKPTADRPLYHRPEDAPPEERLFLDELRDDVERCQPRLIIVHASAGWMALPKGFNTFDYLQHSGWAEQALKPYREVPGPQGWKVFERELPPAAILTAR